MAKSLNIFVALITSYILFFSCEKEQKRTSVPKPELAKEMATPQKDTLHIVAVGDIMIGSAFPSKAYLPKDDGIRSFDKVKEYLKGDVVFGNLEGCFLDQGDSEKCKDHHKKSNVVTCYAFRMPTRYGKVIKDAGFNTLSIANNHVGDFGNAGRKKTAEILDDLNIHYAGQTEKPYDIFEIEGVKYGFCAFAPNKNTVSINKISEAQELVKDLKTKSDIVIVSFHGGAEGAKHTRVPKTKEIFYGENRGDVHHFAHSVVDAGADIVLGHGPHVTRAVEVYKGKLIAYSLGNFNTYGKFNLKGPNGIAPILDIKVDRKGNFLFAHVISTKQTKSAGLQIDENAQAFKAIKELTSLDFPNNALLFTDNKILLNTKT